jgi:alpha-D-ribose 1-methylphosphonate 5-triphosphate diphosphatase
MQHGQACRYRAWCRVSCAGDARLSRWDRLLEILSFDYVPGSLLMAAFDLPRRVAHISLPQAVAMVSRNSARAAGLADRGEIALTQRADLVRVALHGPTPCVRRVWRAGQLVF